jgi:methanogenic corrinoid protein MtbC1
VRWSGFEVVELGADTPAASVGDAVAACPRLVAVGLVAVTDGALVGLRRSVRAAKAAAPGVPVFVGGAAVAGPEAAARLGADRYTPDGRSVVEFVEEAAGRRNLSTGGRPTGPASPASPGPSARR